MVKNIKKILIVVIMFALSFTVVKALSFNKTNYLGQLNGNFGYVDNLLLESSRHTQTEESDLALIDEYHNNYLISYTEKELDYLGFEAVLENGNFILYLEKVSFSILLYNKHTKFWWSSRAENQKDSDGNILNAKNLMNSGLHFELARKDNVSASRKESILTVADALYKENESIIKYFTEFYLEFEYLLSNNVAEVYLKESLNTSLENLKFAITYMFDFDTSLWNDVDTTYLSDLLILEPITNELGLAIKNEDANSVEVAIANLDNYFTNLENDTFINELTDFILLIKTLVNLSDEEGTISEKLLPYAIDNSSLQTANIGTTYQITNNQIKLTVNIRKLRNVITPVEISFSVIVKLLNTGIEVGIDNDSITENSDIYKLLNIAIFPYLGSARENKVPGYFVIPDEMGALIRLNKQFSQSLADMPFYNYDYGYSTSNKSNLKIPIYGIVHEYNENAFYAEIKDGATTTSLQTTLWTLNNDYHKINPVFQVRQVYRTVVNREGEGISTILDRKTSDSYLVEYTFLTGSEASYVGIASNYRNRLIDYGILTEREQTDGNIPFHTSIILSDQEKAFIGTKTIKMTKLDELKSIYNDLKNSGITNQQITLYGWSKDGYQTKAPYKVSYVESEKHLKNFIKDVHSDNNTIFLENDYVLSSNSSRVNYYRDVSEAISRVKITFKTTTLNNEEINYRLVKPDESLKIATKDYKKINKTGFDGLMLDTIGNTLFSEYRNGTIIDRSSQITYYQQLTKLYDQMQIITPNLYLWKNLTGYTQMPIANAQYNQYSDTIPLLPLILKGSISYFGTYLNFNVLGQDHLLQMVDYAINPSYIYTYDDTYQMRYTKAAQFYTTKFSDFKDESVVTYNYLNNALKHVTNTYIVNREVIKTGLVKVTYSNSVIIYINYTTTDQTVEGTLISAKDYRVVN